MVTFFTGVKLSKRIFGFLPTQKYTNYTFLSSMNIYSRGNNVFDIPDEEDTFVAV